MAWTSVPAADWKTLPTVHRARPDPYCIWAELSGWAIYPGDSVPPPAPEPLPWLTRVLRCLWGRITGQPFDGSCVPAPAPNPPPQKRHAVIIELVDAAMAESFIQMAGQNEISVRPCYNPAEYRFSVRRTRYITASATHAGLAALADTAEGRPGSLVTRFDLCDFAAPLRAGGPIPMDQMPGFEPPALRGSKLIGVIDDGCGFAHNSFVRFDASTGKASTRVAAIWDQDEKPIFRGCSVDGFGKFGEMPGRFDYGWRIYRDYPPDPFDIGPRGLDRWISHHRKGPAGSIDEDSCYEHARYESMRRRAAHGTHVMDVVAGPKRLQERVARNRDAPPTWQSVADPASDPAQSDLVFVQLPRAGLQDTSGGWLDAYVLDAVRCISDWRGGTATQTVINLSYGSSTGPRDGSSILSAALDEIVQEESDDPGEIEIVMATGNSFAVRGHGVRELAANEAKPFTWRVLPGGESASFLQLWLPTNSQAAVADVEVSIRVPGSGDTVSLKLDEVAKLELGGKVCAVAAFVAKPSRGGRPMLLIALQPTLDQRSLPGAVAPHGDWVVTVNSGGAPLGKVEASIAANEKRMAGRLRGRQSYFVDAIDEGRRYMAAPSDDPGVGNTWDDGLQDQAARSQGYVRRRGTMNAIACGAEPFVIAGYSRNYSDNIDDGAHAPYSSAGKAGGRLPNAACPTDQSAVLRGMRAAGTRSGSTFRLVGTSSAAPQYARKLLAGVAQPPPSPKNDPDLSGSSGRWPIG